MSTAADCDALRACPHHAELLSLVAERATHEGRTDSIYPGLAFCRASRETSCDKTGFSGATLAVVLWGQMKVRLGRERFAADRMHYLVVTRETGLGEAHEVTTVPAGPDAPYLALSLTFPAETVVKALVALTDAGAAHPQEDAAAFVWPTEAAVANALVRLLKAVDDPVERAVLAPMIVEECALRLLRCDAAGALRSAIQGEHDVVKVESAMRFMRTNAQKSLSVQQIARHVGMSESHFAHRFRDVARVSPMRYLRHLRLEDARALMLAEGTRPSEAASRVGFESTSHFTREFKRRFGASPAEYVRRFRE